MSVGKNSGAGNGTSGSLEMLNFQVEDSRLSSGGWDAGMMAMSMGMFTRCYKNATLSDAGVEGNAGLNSASANQDRWVSVGVIRDPCQILRMLGEVTAKGISCSKAPNCKGFPYF